MYKLIAIDIDDTLLNDEGMISQKNKDAIRRAENAGVKVIAASGRSYASSKRYIEELGLKNLMVCLNGAYIQDPEKDRLVAEFSVEKTIAQEILKDVAPFHVHINLSCGGNVYCQGPPSEQSELYSRMNGIQMDYVDSLLELSRTKQAGKLLLCDDPEKLKPIKDLLVNKYGEILNIAFSKPILLELTDKKASKGASLLRVAEIYRISPKEIIAMGDGENDLGMIQSVGMGIAVANAKEKIKEAADFVTLSNNESGVAYAINKFIFHEN